MNCNRSNARLSQSFGIIITNKCTAECDFCCNDSAPHQNLELNLDDVLDVVQQAYDCGFRQVCYTGGEPILRLRDILRAGKLGHSLGMSLTINTNGFFGANRRQAQNILERLRDVGLVKATLSFDDSHAKYIPASAIATVMDICRELSIETHLNCSFYEGGHRLSHFFSEEQLAGVKTLESPVQSTGRAESSDTLCKPSGIPQDLCPTPLGMVVNFDGNYYPCCSVSGFNKRIAVGNIRECTLAEAIHNTLNDNYIFYIQKRGLSDFFESSSLLSTMASRAHSVCDLCKVATGSDYVYSRAMNFVDGEFHKYAKITLDRLYQTKASKPTGQASVGNLDN
jgi:organic radical activating enzyme